jgi:hypothetical protein
MSLLVIQENTVFPLSCPGNSFDNIYSYRGGDYEDYSLNRCSAEYSDRILRAFWRKLKPPSLQQNNVSYVKSFRPEFLIQQMAPV